MKTIKLTILISALIISKSIAFGENKPKNIDLKRAQAYFQEIKTAVERDNGELWGIKLDGSFMFVDNISGEIIANKQDNFNSLKEIDGIYFGKLEQNVGIANTSFNWHDETWTMVIWQHIPENKYNRISLFMHEMWHSVQDEIGLPSSPSKNNHLDELWGRILLRMEWHALLEALKNDVVKDSTIQEALIFRNCRRELFPGKTIAENNFEMHEGIAAYTGIKLSEMPFDIIVKELENKLDYYESQKRYLMTFAYLSGPLYGFLIHQKNPQWNKELNRDSDLGQILAQYYKIELPVNLKKAFENISAKGAWQEIINNEKQHEQTQQEKIRFYNKLFFSDSTLLIFNQNTNITFNPMQVTSLGDKGDVYQTFTAKANWGELNVVNGAIFRFADWTKFLLPNPTEINKNGAKGLGWILNLNEGWEITFVEKNYIIRKLLK